MPRKPNWYAPRRNENPPQWWTDMLAEIRAEREAAKQAYGASVIAESREPPPFC